MASTALLTETHKMQPKFLRLEPATIRYIKLGAGNVWAETALELDELPLGDPEISHETAAIGDWTKIAKTYRDSGKTAGAASRLTREMREFYELDADCLWITPIGLRLYWGFAQAGVSCGQGRPYARWRRMVGAWKCTDCFGKEIVLPALSSVLTKTFGTQSTICKVAASDYLLRKLNADLNPLIAEAHVRETVLAQVVMRLLPQLDARDFELLVARIAVSFGWRLETEVGGGQPDIDFFAKLPALDLACAAQVKTAATQAQIDRFVAKCGGGGRRLLFAYHTPIGSVRTDANTHPDLDLWTGEDLARKAIRAGLLPWICERAA